MKNSFTLCFLLLCLCRNTFGVIQYHHVFPQEFGSYYSARGIDIHAYTIGIDKQFHMQGLHYPKNGLKNWNDAWRAFIKENPNATKRNIILQQNKMLKEYGVPRDVEFSEYNKAKSPSGKGTVGRPKEYIKIRNQNTILAATGILIAVGDSIFLVNDVSKINKEYSHGDLQSDQYAFQMGYQTTRGVRNMSLLAQQYGLLAETYAWQNPRWAKIAGKAFMPLAITGESLAFGYAWHEYSHDRIGVREFKSRTVGPAVFVTCTGGGAIIGGTVGFFWGGALPWAKVGAEAGAVVAIPASILADQFLNWKHKEYDKQHQNAIHNALERKYSTG